MEIDESCKAKRRVVRKPAETLSEEGDQVWHPQHGEEEALFRFRERAAADSSSQGYLPGAPAATVTGADVRHSTTEKQHTNRNQRLATLIKGDYDYTRPRRGEVREAVILSIGENDMVVDLGAKRDGIIPPKDLELLDDAYRASLEVRDHVPVVILKTWGRRDGAILVSLNKGLERKDWLRVQDLLESGKVFEAEVMEFNRGGVVVPFGHLRGFVPNSHLTSIPRSWRGKRLRETKAELVGRMLSLVVIEVNQRKRRLVLSERVAGRRRCQQLLEELTEGEVRTGIVCNLVDFGAFVDLGGLDGLIHISELDWKHMDHPSEVLNVGDEVEVYVLNVDRERKRIGLSRKRLLPDPWYRVTEALREGDIVEGTVTNVVEFGAFVDLGGGVEGLVHTSEMPKEETTFSDLEPGSPVTVRVLGIDECKRQIALRLQEIVPSNG
jgi:small subunit ribosomal protein S1